MLHSVYEEIVITVNMRPYQKYTGVEQNDRIHLEGYLACPTDSAFALKKIKRIRLEKADFEEIMRALNTLQLAA